MPTNDYPLHIERQAEKIYEKIFKKISDRVLREYIKLFKSETKALETDANPFKALENELFKDLDNILKSKTLEKELTKIGHLLDSWTRARIKRQIDKIVKANKRTFPIEFDEESPQVLNFIDKYKKFNVQLVQDLGKELIPEVGDLSYKTFVRGGSMKELRQGLLKHTEGQYEKARFWARDQVGDAYSQFTNIRQTENGIQSYIWRTVGDSHVRGLKKTDKTSHIALEGMKFSWKAGAAKTGQLSKKNAKHPGEDYNCRCAAEPFIEGFTSPGVSKTVQFLDPGQLSKEKRKEIEGRQNE